MQSLDTMTPDIARKIRAVFTDIDDTLTTGGKLPGDAYQALWRLHDAGIAVVPVTGRPAGWCDLIARQWPVEGVVGENGALAYYEQDGRLIRLYHPDVAGDDAQERLRTVKEAVLQEVPHSRVAKDQFARLYDLAIDFSEEPPHLDLGVADQIAEVFRRMGARAKVSSIHVNGWFGDYDKLSMTRLFTRERWGLDLDEHREEFLFCGDSLNDEPMFAWFPYACGVANVHDFKDAMTSLPKFGTSGRGGEGFCQLADRLLELRAD